MSDSVGTYKKKKAPLIDAELLSIIKIEQQAPKGL